MIVTPAPGRSQRLLENTSKQQYRETQAHLKTSQVESSRKLSELGYLKKKKKSKTLNIPLSTIKHAIKKCKNIAQLRLRLKETG